MEEILNAATIPFIVFVVYWVINLLKLLTNYNEKFLRFIPLIATGLGAILGVIIFYAVPEVLIAENVLNAVIVGASSGLASTGFNQIFKQLSKPIQQESNDQTTINKQDNE